MKIRHRVRNSVRDWIRLYNRFQLIDFGHYFHKRDIRFLQECLPQRRVIDWDDPTFSGDSPTGPISSHGIFWNVLWRCALARVYHRPILKTVEYRFGDRSFTMELDLTEAPECSYYLSDPTPHLTRLIRRGGGVLIDIGANAGIHALTAGLFFDRVYAIEPAPATYRRLARNVELSGASNVMAANVAVSDRRDTVAFEVCKGHGGMSRVRSRATKRSIDVPATTLDTYVGEQDIGAVDFIKIDVEGHEVAVFRGARRTIERCRPMIFAELFDRRWARAVLAGLPGADRVFNPATGEEIDRRAAPKEAPRAGNLLLAVSDPYSAGLEQARADQPRHRSREQNI